MIKWKNIFPGKIFEAVSARNPISISLNTYCTFYSKTFYTAEPFSLTPALLVTGAHTSLLNDITPAVG